ncbi:MAG: DUF3365 domain-containing protein, partial [Thermodesulfovibrionales bacterium]|nr:DUF3365 domain-containing protein [Thermodesulfovibrionales bacterium]
MDSQNRKVYLKYLVIPIIILLMVLGLSLLWDILRHNETSSRIALNRAQAFYNIIQAHRIWNSEHGGVYVSITDKMQPNPYLADPRRDVTTLGGLSLTKVNPAFMTRQVSEIVLDHGNVLFHITSLLPLNPDNKADKWETSALRSFREEDMERFELMDMNEKHVYRYMAPLRVRKFCLPCHADQGYKLGDIRGGISVTFPAEPFIQADKGHLNSMLLTYAAIFLLGFLSLSLYMYRLMINEKKLERYRDHLEDLLKERENDEALLKAIIGSTADGILVVDKNANIIHTNKKFAEMWNIPEELMNAKKDKQIFTFALKQLEKPKEFTSLIRRLYESDDTNTGIITSNNGCIFEHYSCPLFQGKYHTGRVWSFRDITERKKAEEEIKEYTRMQSVLIKEIDHRVKNNLYTILGMINAEKERVGNEGKELVSRLAGRILGLSAVHGMLSRNEWRPIELDSLSKEILKGVFSAMPESRNATYIVTPSGIMVGNQQAHQLAMLINELATNSLKHRTDENKT